MRAAYERARRYLLGDSLSEESLRKKHLFDTAKMLGFENEKLAKLQELLARSKTVDEVVEEFRKLRTEVSRERSSEYQLSRLEEKHNNIGYDVVQGEDTLVRMLKQGWELEKELKEAQKQRVKDLRRQLAQVANVLKMSEEIAIARVASIIDVDKETLTKHLLSIRNDVGIGIKGRFLHVPEDQRNTFLNALETRLKEGGLIGSPAGQNSVTSKGVKKTLPRKPPAKEKP